MKKNEYDVVIIGAGIGGLVCGCYLAKSGKKVLIVEKNDHVGGCCTSFTRSGYLFNACVHSLGSCRRGGVVNQMLSELSIKNQVNLERYDPSDVVLTPDFKIPFYNSMSKFRSVLKKHFKRESLGIENFLDFICNSSQATLFLKTKDFTLSEVFDAYFKNEKLRSILAAPIMGNGGLPPFLMSAFVGSNLLKEFILDGGYLPARGAQSLSDAIADKAAENGCLIRMSTEITKIIIRNGNAEGVVLDNGVYIRSKVIIANCSVPDVFGRLLPKKERRNFVKEIADMKTSLSIYSIYLGMKKSYEVPDDLQCNLWYLPSYNLKNTYNKVMKGRILDKDVYLAIYTSSYRDLSNKKKTVCLLVNTPYKTRDYWQKNYKSLFNHLIDKAENILPGLSKHFSVSAVATPYSIHKYTGNYKGASYGWAPLLSQTFSRKFLKNISSIRNLKFVGHWTTEGLGVPSVVGNARKHAMSLLRQND